MATIIHIKDAPKGWKTNSKYIYIGRGSKFGNPFIIGEDGNREEVCYKHGLWLERWILYKDEITIKGYNNKRVIESLHELEDKILVCFCKPLQCHGDILIDLLILSKLNVNISNSNTECQNCREKFLKDKLDG